MARYYTELKRLSRYHEELKLLPEARVSVLHGIVIQPVPVLSRNNLTLRFGCGLNAVRLRFVCGSVAVLLRSTDKNRKRPQEKITQLVYDAYRSFPMLW